MSSNEHEKTGGGEEEEVAASASGGTRVKFMCPSTYFSIFNCPKK